MSNYKDYLHSIWYDTKNPVSYSGPDKLYQFVKSDGKFNVGLRRIKQWLQDQDAYSLQRNVIRKFKRNRVVVNGIDSMWDRDLADVQSLSKYNDNYKYLLLVIDIFSRFLQVIPLRNKTAKEIVSGLKAVFSKRQPEIIRFDKGSEFKNRWVTDYLEKQHIRFFFTQNETKANYIERAIKTLKASMYRYFRANQTYKYINKIQDLVDNYNHRPHSALGNIAPIDVNKNNESEVRYEAYLARQKRRKLSNKTVQSSLKSTKRKISPYKFKINDLVRISHLKHPFQRDYQQKWTEELFYISHRYVRQKIPVYKIEEYDKTPITGTFYEKELQKVNPKVNYRWHINKILKKRKRGKISEVFVDWMGWPKKYRSWIDEKEIVSV